MSWTVFSLADGRTYLAVQKLSEQRYNSRTYLKECSVWDRERSLSINIIYNSHAHVYIDLNSSLHSYTILGFRNTIMPQSRPTYVYTDIYYIWPLSTVSISNLFFPVPFTLEKPTFFSNFTNFSFRGVGVSTAHAQDLMTDSSFVFLRAIKNIVFMYVCM